MGAKFLGYEFRVGCGCDHRRVVGGERTRGEEDRDSLWCGVLLEAVPSSVGGDAARDKQCGGTAGAGGGQSLSHQIFHHGPLKRCDQVPRLRLTHIQVVIKLWVWDFRNFAAAGLNGFAHVVGFHVAQDGSLDAAVGKMKLRRLPALCRGRCGRDALTGT